MNSEDPRDRRRLEEDWNDRINDPEEEETNEAPPVYRDGSARNECWSEEGYTG